MYLVTYDYKQLISERARSRRLQLKLTQEGLASRSGVSLGTIKRFERTGEISLSSLLQLALVLDALDDFQHLFQEKEALPQSLDEILNKPKARQRGRIK
ncbi:MAG: helix-turn-helix transcriptional regulator [Synechococcaceae cyanobacterium SM2_3_1]|nr:helix-turn-helix transcriptional regulator [Synechococcaceae cyanobacterium SM2_3_1]